MAKIEAKNLYKIFGPRQKQDEALGLSRNGKSQQEVFNETGCTVAVKDVTFSVDGPEIFVIMGLSGSGKSTLLRCINRLIEPSAGEVRLDEDNVLEMDPKQILDLRKKKTAMVFQHFGLLSHRSVLENTAFGLELMHVSESERNEKAREALELVGLSEQAHHRVGELSGGMQQRVGLARALATEAEILLMDEAFSALDPLIRTRMQSEFLELQEKIPKTILFITHDLGEALRLGDRVAIMKEGGVDQIGGPEEIITSPETDYVEAFVENVDRSRVLRVSTVSVKTQPSIGPNDSVRKAVEHMEKHDVPYVFVLKDGKIEGTVDFRQAAREAEKDDSDLQHIIEPAPEAVKPDEKLIAVLTRIAETRVPLPVVDENGRLRGVVDKDRILRAIAGGEL